MYLQVYNLYLVYNANLCHVRHEHKAYRKLGQMGVKTGLNHQAKSKGGRSKILKISKFQNHKTHLFSAFLYPQFLPLPVHLPFCGTFSMILSSKALRCSSYSLPSSHRPLFCVTPCVTFIPRTTCPVLEGQGKA